MDGDSNLELIIVGCGKWGTNLINNAYSMKSLAALVDSSESIRNTLNQRFPNVPIYSTLTETFPHHSTAAVIVATPPQTHFKVAMEALHANRHVFVEKPICDSIDDAKELVAEAKKRNLVLMVDHLLQYSKPHRRLIHLAATGFVGKVNRVRMCRVNFGTIRTVEDVLWSFCPHDLSILLSLVCPASNTDINSSTTEQVYPTSVTCQGQYVVSPNIADYVDICISFSSGAKAHVEASWLNPIKERRVIVYGTAGSIVLNEDMPDKSLSAIQAYKWTTKRREDGSAVDIEKVSDDMQLHLSEFPEGDTLAFSSDTQPLRSVLEYFVNCASSNSPASRSSGDEALSVLRLLDAATRSLQQGGIEIPLETDATSPNGNSSHEPTSTNKRKIDVADDGNKKAKTNGSTPKYFAHSTAVVDKGANVGDGTKIWHFSHIMNGAKIGNKCNIGQNVYVGSDTSLGCNVKVQNNVSIYDSVHVEDDVFLGPSCVFTNVKNPRSHVSRKHMYAPTKVEKGVTVGANATIVCGTTLGKYCFVGAGAVVTKDIQPHALVYGNPAVRKGWVSTTGIQLTYTSDAQAGAVTKTHRNLVCPETGEKYREICPQVGEAKPILEGPL